MSFSAGVFSINSQGQPVVYLTTISETAFNALTADLATGLSTCVLKDGTQTTTAVVPFAYGLDLSAATGGTIKFPATQNASSNANTLDDYEEGTWVPVLTAATAGDIAVGYTTQVGTYTKIGRQLTCNFVIITSSFTWSTASGALKITGLPYAAMTLSGYQTAGDLTFSGVTKATYTQFSPLVVSAASVITFNASGTAVGGSAMTIADLPTGGTPYLVGSITYFTA